MRTFLVVAFVVVSAAGSDAAFLDGSQLREWCVSADEGNQGACLGFVVGVADMLSSSDAGGATKRRACVPDIEATQAVSTARKYLESHPRTDQAAASELVASALAEAFPCP